MSPADRRSALKLFGAGILTPLAGCIGDSNSLGIDDGSRSENDGRNVENDDRDPENDDRNLESHGCDRDTDDPSAITTFVSDVRPGETAEVGVTVGKEITHLQIYPTSEAELLDFEYDEVELTPAPAGTYVSDPPAWTWETPSAVAATVPVTAADDAGLGEYDWKVRTAEYDRDHDSAEAFPEFTSKECTIAVVER